MKVIGVSKVNIPTILHPKFPYYALVLEDENKNKWAHKSIKEKSINEELSFPSSSSDKNAVAVWRIKYDLNEAVEKAINLLDGLGLKEGTKVLIVPALVSPSHAYFRDNTSPEFLDAVLDFLDEKKVNIKIGGQSFDDIPIEASAQRSGLLDICLKHKITPLNLSQNSFIKQNNLEDPLGQKTYLAWAEEGREELSKIVPEEQEKVYDMKLVIEEIFDKNSFFEIHSRFAANAVIGLARLSGNAVGIVANQTKFLAGVLDIDSSDKIARFVRFCDAFNLPVINLVDTPGYLPGTSQEHQGIIRHGAKVLYAYAEASVPKISLIVRKAFGGAYIALCSRHLGHDKVIAWPKARIAVMGAEQAVKIIYRKQIAENPDIEKEKIEELKSKFLNPFEAAKLGQIDMIIEPKETRTILIKCLDSLLTKREQSMPKKHGNIPT